MVNTLVLRPLPYENPDRLVMLAYGGSEASPADFFDWKAQNSVLTRVAAISFWNANLGSVETPERLQGFLVSSDLFPMLGVQPAIGRSFLPEEEQSGKDAVVIVSHAVSDRARGLLTSQRAARCALTRWPHYATSKRQKSEQRAP